MRPKTNRTISGVGLVSDFDIDRYSLQILQMIHAKYSREYLPFFAMLSTMYANSKRGKEIREQITWINRVRVIIEMCIFSGKVGGDQAMELYELFDKIEERKQLFLDDVKQNNAMQQKMDRITQSIGISITDLNLTKDMLKAGVKQARKKSRRDFESKYPESGRRLKRIGEGMKVAALGPFTPIFDLLADIGKIISYRSQRNERREEARIAAGLGVRGLSEPFPTPTAPSTIGPSVAPGYIPHTAPYADPLFSFFNTKAYKAKWTKELLERMKEVGKGGIGNAGIVGALLKYLVAAGAVIVSGKKVLDAIQASKQAKEAGTKATISGTELGKVIAKRDAEIKHIGIEAASDRYKKTPQQIIKESAEREHTRQRTMYGASKAREPAIAKIPGLRWVTKQVTGYERPKVQSIEEIQKQYERRFNYTPTKIDTKQLDDIVAKAIKQMETTAKSVDKLAEKVGNTQTETKPVGVGNPFDSADPLINQLSSGKLTIGGK